MATTIDQRVVEMRFDNDQFEKGVNQSINSIDKLKSSLDFGDFNKSVKSTVNPSISSIGETIEAVANKFNSFENIVRTTAIVKYANKILDVFSSIKKMFGTDMMKLGWSKYEELMSSTQTIMFATRDEWEDQSAQMEFIEGQLEKLMWYTDETSYDFADMANNIGKFTSAGVGLEDSVSAMMGISSWAALSGKNAQAAGVAMYNLSQALAIGAVTTADWKSIELQNMATKEFKQTVIDTAVAMGKLKEGEVDVESFRTSLKTKWFDNEVLLAVLKKFGDFSMQLNEAVNETGLTASEFRGYIQDFKDGVITMDDLGTIIARDEIEDAEGFTKWMEILTDEYYDLGFEAFKAGQECKTFTDVLNATKDALSTGWLQTFKAITGNYLQSKELWSGLAEDLYDIFVEPLNVRNNILKSFNKNGGRDAAIEGLLNIWHSVVDVFLELRDAYNKAFPKTTGLQLSIMANEFLRVTKTFRNMIDMAIKYGVFEKIAKNIGTAVNNMRITFTRVGRAFAEAWEAIFPSHGAKFKVIADIIEGVELLSEKILKLSEDLKIGMGKSIEDTETRYGKLRRTFMGVIAIIDIIKQLMLAIIKPFSKVEIKSSNLLDTVLDNTAAWGDWMVALDKTIEETGVFDKAVDTVIQFFKDLPGYVDQATRALFGLSAEDTWTAIVNGAKLAIGAILSLFLDVSSIEDLDIVTIWEAVKKKAQETWNTIIEFCTDVPDKMDQLRSALFGTDYSSWGEVWTDITGKVKTAYETVGKFFGWIKEYDENGFEKNSPFEQFIMDLQDKWDWFMGKLDELKTKWEPVGEWIMENIFSKEGLDEGKKVLKTAGIVGSIAALLFLLYKVVFTAKDTLTLIKGLRGISEEKDGGIIARIMKVFGPASYAQDMAGAAKTQMINFGKLLKGGYFAMIGLLVLELAASLMIVSKCLADNPATTISALIILLGGFFIVFEMAASLITTPGVFGSDLQGAGMMFGLLGAMFIAMAASLWIISNYVKPDMLWPSVLALGGLLVVLTIVMIAINKFVLSGSSDAGTKMLQMGASFVMIAASVLIIAAALRILAGYSVGDLMPAVLAIGLVLGIIVALAAVVGYSEPIQIGLANLATHILMFGAAAALVGAGIWLAVDAITRFISISPEQLENIGNGLVYVFGTILPQLVPLMGDLFRMLLDEFIKSGPKIQEALYTLGEIIITTIDFLVPAILTSLGNFLIQLIDLANALLPRLEVLFVNLWDFIMTTSEVSLLGLGQLIWTVTLGLLNQALDNVGELVAILTAIGIEMILGFIEGVRLELPHIVEEGWNFVITFINSIADGMDEHAPELRAAIEHLASSAIKAFKTVFGFKETDTVEKDESSSFLDSLGKNLVGSAINGISSKISEMWKTITEFGSKIINGLREGMENAASAVSETAGKVANGVISTVTGVFQEHSPSKVAEDIGEYFDLGLMEGLEGKANAVKESAADVATTAKDGFTAAIGSITDLLNSDMDLFPTITPVIDLSIFDEGISSMTNTLLGMAGIDMNSLTGGFNANLAGQNAATANLAGLASMLGTEEGGSINSPNVTNNTFNVTGDDPKAIAMEISNILQRQVERRTAVWGT